jgi:hypothetical protein
MLFLRHELATGLEISLMLFLRHELATGLELNVANVAPASRVSKTAMSLSEGQKKNEDRAVSSTTSNLV